MSVQDKLREGLYDAEHKPRLNYARIYFLEYGGKEPDLEGLVRFHGEWRDYDEYLILQKHIESLEVPGEVVTETYAMKCSKRGNDVYWWRVDKRLRFLYELKDRALFDPHGNVKFSNVLYATLTYDVKRCTVREAWVSVGEDVNNWIRNLRKKFGKISYLRGWEASQRGYPHVHMIMIFSDYKFKIAFRQYKNNREVYRIGEKEEFEKSWHSFVDVQAIREVRQGIAHVTKYMRKTPYHSETQELTLALCWIFRKRSFAVSGDLQDLVTGLLKRARFQENGSRWRI